MIKLISILGVALMMAGGHPKTGTDAYSIELKNPKGKNVTLESLKGKYVLIDFWASWCGPCRRESPNVVEAYNKYKKSTFNNAKGFEVFSVSLDRDKVKWEKAIEQDGLIWDAHGFDEGGKVARMYGVNSIPYAILVDGEGKIVAQGNELRGLNLHITIEKFIEK